MAPGTYGGVTGPSAAGGAVAARGPILIVEDDRATRELLAVILAEEGLPCVLSASGHEAMSLARKAPPVMAVLDLHLPAVPGEALATALRIDHGASLPVLAMSAGSETEAAKRMGAFAYLQKPFDVDDFVRLVREGLALAERTATARANAAAARQRLDEALQRQRQPPPPDVRAAS